MSPETPRLNAEAAELARAAGSALSTWTIIETNLTDLFAVLIGAEPIKAHIAMQAVISFDARMQMVCDLMDAWDWPQDERDMWSILVNRIQKQQKKRNELAHFQIIHRSDGRRTYAVLSPFYSTLAAQTGTLRELLAPDIIARADRFRALAIAVSWFAGAARRLKNTPSRGLPPEPDPVRDLRTSIDQSRADKQRRDQASAE